MKSLTEIVAAYQALDIFLENQRAEAAARSDESKQARIEAQQLLNDQAYFILAWGQLEAAIDDKCRLAIRGRRAKVAWRDRRLWDLFNPDDKRLSGVSFEERTAVVLDKSAGAGSPWAEVMGYYNMRNQIAHGQLRPKRIDVVAVAADFWTIQSALQS